MTRDKCVEAMFGTTLDTTVAGGGTVIVQPEASLIPYGTTVRLTALPDPGNAFAVWGNAATGTNNPLHFVLTNANPVISAAFAPLNAGQHALTVIAEGFGSVSSNPRGNRFNIGTNVTLTALPDEGQQFIGWSGDADGSQNPLPVPMNESKVITAQFTERPTLSLQPCVEPDLTDGFQFLVTGEFGVRYQIERNENWQGWIPVGTLTNIFGVTQFRDPDAPNRPRFYRGAVLAP